MLKSTIVLTATVLLTGWANITPEWPHSGPLPDERVDVPSSGYRSIGAGLKTYRPVEPLPWGDINRRVAPPGSPGSMPAESQQSQPQAPPAAPSKPPEMAPMPGMQH